ncbi:hypothetical protein [Lutibacter sp.]
MSRNYKFHKPEGLYFISFAVVDWLDVFSHHTKGFVREHRVIEQVLKVQGKWNGHFDAKYD